MKRVLLIVVALALMAPAVARGNTLSVSCSAANGQCDESGDWQYSPVAVTWQATPVPSKVVGCDSTTYTDAMTTVSCQVWWGTSTQQIAFPLNVETSSPTATATPSRPPDSNGWYNHPVDVTFHGSSFSNIASCTPATTFAGPANGAATVAGTCTDNAGKTVAASLNLAYDAAPPSLTATATSGDRAVALSWQTSGYAPIASISVFRSPGPGNAVYSGTASGFQDTGVQDGVPYTYTVTAVDQAGNTASQTITATPQAHLVAPANTAHLASPPLLSWTPVRGATYYNVQLLRDGKKMLSVWPTEAHLQLRRIWRFDGRRYRLRPGRYRWFVWPGFGKRRAAHYGHMIGSWTFVIAR